MYCKPTTRSVYSTSLASPNSWRRNVVVFLSCLQELFRWIKGKRKQAIVMVNSNIWFEDNVIAKRFQNVPSRFAMFQSQRALFICILKWWKIILCIEKITWRNFPLFKVVSNFPYKNPCKLPREAQENLESIVDQRHIPWGEGPLSEGFYKARRACLAFNNEYNALPSDHPPPLLLFTPTTISASHSSSVEQSCSLPNWQLSEIWLCSPMPNECI